MSQRHDEDMDDICSIDDDFSNDLGFINGDYGDDLFSNDLDQLVRTQ